MIVRKIEVEELPLSGAFLIRPLEFKDERGSFYKFYTDETLKAIGTNSMFPEEYLSVSKKNVIRGLHYQLGEKTQAKLVRCTAGRIFDVLVDLRKS
ncbi:MAG: dTDP-4-dehydrorhamnose 3,5-epimerase family protein, partial [Candidatus Micrarchaeota archaeon]